MKNFNPDISICIVGYNGEKLLADCLSSIYQNIKGLTYEVIVVDNNSSDGSMEMVKAQFPRVHIIQNSINHGFAKANNQAIHVAIGKYILLLNQDVVILNSDSIRIMKDFLDSREDAAVCGCNYIDSKGVCQSSQCRFQTIRYLISYYFRKLLARKKHKDNPEVVRSPPREIDMPVGACFMIKREVIDKIGLLDEAFFFYFEEADWCFRIKSAGWKIYLLPYVYVKHHFHSNRALNAKLQYQYQKSQYIFFKKSYGRLNAFLLLVINEIVNGLRLLYVICEYFCGLADREKRASRSTKVKNAFRLFCMANTMPL